LFSSKIRATGLESAKVQRIGLKNTVDPEIDRSTWLSRRKVNHSIRRYFEKIVLSHGIAYVELFKSVAGVGCYKGK